jgi:hypothetical protein
MISCLLYVFSNILFSQLACIAGPVGATPGITIVDEDPHSKVPMID